VRLLIWRRRCKRRGCLWVLLRSVGLRNSLERRSSPFWARELSQKKTSSTYSANVRLTLLWRLVLRHLEILPRLMPHLNRASQIMHQLYCVRSGQILSSPSAHLRWSILDSPIRKHVGCCLCHWSKSAAKCCASDIRGKFHCRTTFLCCLLTNITSIWKGKTESLNWWKWAITNFQRRSQMPNRLCVSNDFRKRAVPNFINHRRIITRVWWWKEL